MNSVDKFKKFREESIDEFCECVDLYEDLEIVEAEYQGKKVTLNDPIRTSENQNKKDKQIEGLKVANPSEKTNFQAVESEMQKSTLQKLMEKFSRK